MFNYFRTFLPNFATLSAPLRELLKNYVEFCWNKQTRESFTRIKTMLANTPVS